MYAINRYEQLENEENLSNWLSKYLMCLGICLHTNNSQCLQAPNIISAKHGMQDYIPYKSLQQT